MTENYQINISEKNKSFLWLPPKTGTVHATFIFNHFEFYTFHSNSENELRKGYLQHNHARDLFPNHENFKLISTARNPYTKIISIYKYNLQKKEEFHYEGFRVFFLQKTQQPHFWTHFDLSYKRTPDFFIRMENLYLDYVQIPFIRDSKINKCGVLEDLCKIEMNSTIELPQTKDFFTSDMIDYVYRMTKDYMNLLKYEYPY